LTIGRRRATPPAPQKPAQVRSRGGTFLIDKQGIVRYIHQVTNPQAFVEKDELMREVEQLNGEHLSASVERTWTHFLASPFPFAQAALRRKYFVERGGCVGIEIVHHHDHLRSCLFYQVRNKNASNAIVDTLLLLVV
jgi:hypothetical protein